MSRLSLDLGLNTDFADFDLSELIETPESPVMSIERGSLGESESQNQGQGQSQNQKPLLPMLLPVPMLVSEPLPQVGTAHPNSAPTDALKSRKTKSERRKSRISFFGFGRKKDLDHDQFNGYDSDATEIDPSTSRNRQSMLPTSPNFPSRSQSSNLVLTSPLSLPPVARLPSPNTPPTSTQVLQSQVSEPGSWRSVDNTYPSDDDYQDFAQHSESEDEGVHNIALEELRVTTTAISTTTTTSPSSSKGPESELEIHLEIYSAEVIRNTEHNANLVLREKDIEIEQLRRELRVRVESQSSPAAINMSGSTRVGKRKVSFSNEPVDFRILPPVGEPLGDEIVQRPQPQEPKNSKPVKELNENPVPIQNSSPSPILNPRRQSKRQSLAVSVDDNTDSESDSDAGMIFRRRLEVRHVQIQTRQFPKLSIETQTEVSSSHMTDLLTQDQRTQALQAIYESTTQTLSSTLIKLTQTETERDVAISDKMRQLSLHNDAKLKFDALSALAYKKIKELVVDKKVQDEIIKLLGERVRIAEGLCVGALGMQSQMML